MLPILEKLLVLQDRDRRVLQLKAEQARIPRDLAAVDARVSEETQKLDSARNDLKRLESERKQLEIAAESKRAQIAKYRAQLALIKSNTEYQALLKEIATHEAEINRIEDDELELMAQVEALQPRLKEEKETLKELQTRAEQDRQTLKTRAAQIEQELNQIAADRDQIVAECDPDLLSRYQRIMHSKGDAAIVPIRHGNCGGCHLNLPAQIAHDCHFSAEPVSCQYCGRILYWPAD